MEIFNGGHFWTSVDPFYQKMKPVYCGQFFLNDGHSKQVWGDHNCHPRLTILCASKVPCELVCLSLCDPVSRIKGLGFPKEPSVEWYVRGLRDADIPWNAPCPQLGPIFSRTHRSFYHYIVTWYWLSSTNVLDHRSLNKLIFLSARRA